MNELLQRLTRIVRFLTADIWRLQAHKLPPRRSLWVTRLRILLLAVRRFNLDKCALRASALTFYSLLSIVPVVALAFAVAKGFGIEKTLGEQILARLPGNEEAAQKIIGFAHSLLEETKGGAIAGAGVALLLWTVIKLLGNIEKSFNDIWGITTPRSFGRRIADYLSVTMTCPILIIVASSATVLVATRAASVIERLSFLGYLAAPLLLLLKLLPYVVIWIVFTFIYAFMPNTRVGMKSALWGGILAGTAYQLVQLAYVSFQIGVSKFGAIYGSFAALPLFLVWLELSWTIVLLGAEVSFAHQNVSTYEYEQDCLGVSHSFRRMVAVLVASRCVKAFLRGEEPLTAEDISRGLDAPVRLIRSVLSELTRARVLSEVCRAGRGEVAYEPALDVRQLTVAGVVKRLDDQGVSAVPIQESPDVQRLRDSIARFGQRNEQSSQNTRLQDL